MDICRRITVVIADSHEILLFLQRFSMAIASPAILSHCFLHLPLSDSNVYLSMDIS